MKRFTLAEANALIPRVRARVLRLQEEVTGYRFAREQVEDLARMWGPRVHDPACRDHEDYQRHHGEAEALENRIKDTLAELGEMGVEVKDPLIGLVDFVALRPGTDEAVYLCWKLDEAEITHWHPLQGGFAARRPVSEL